jgi:pimeloyl-ACP methyl ester carboxylesterase
MKRRASLAGTAVASAAGGAAKRAAGAPAAKTFVLVHGAWHGGWCWVKVAAILRGRGHTVLTPTQTGLGERSHLLSPAIDLDTFVADIANVLQFEDLKDVVLVGHSFGGNAVSGVADRMPGRLRQLVYLDAVILEDGQSVFSKLPSDVVAARKKAAQETSGGLTLPAPPASAFGIARSEEAQWVESRLTPHPLKTYTTPLRLAHPVGNGVPAVYITCTDPLYNPLQSTRDWVKEREWTTAEIATGHDAMVTAPDRLAEMLEADWG